MYASIHNFKYFAISMVILQKLIKFFRSGKIALMVNNNSQRCRRYHSCLYSTSIYLWRYISLKAYPKLYDHKIWRSKASKDLLLDILKQYYNTWAQKIALMLNILEQRIKCLLSPNMTMYMHCNKYCRANLLKVTLFEYQIRPLSNNFLFVNIALDFV